MPTFPLAPDQRPKLHVDLQTINWWKQQARIEITGLLGDRNSWYYRGKDAMQLKTLQPAFVKRNVRGYASTAAPGKTEYFFQGVLNVSLEDVAYALYCDETADQHMIAAHLYQENFLDSAVLDVYDRRTTEDPFRFAGVKWVTYIIPPKLVTAPEFVYFEFSCKTRDADGQVVLVQYTMCPEFAPEQLEEHNVGLARAHTGQITTFRLLEEGTHCQSAGWLESNPSVPGWVATKAVEQIFSNVDRLVGLADARAIAGLGAASSVSTSKACYLCNKKFGLLHKRRNCRSCGQSICVKCTIKLKVLTEPAMQPQDQQKQQQPPSRSSSSNSNPKFVEDRFCLPCVLEAREQRPESGSLAEVGDSLSSEATAPSSSLDDDRNGIDLSELHASIDDLDDLVGIERNRHQGLLLSSRGPERTKTAALVVNARKKKKSVSPVEAYLAQVKEGREQTNQKATKRTVTYPFMVVDLEQQGWSSSRGGSAEQRYSQCRASPKWDKRASYRGSTKKKHHSQRRTPPRTDKQGSARGDAEILHRSRHREQLHSDEQSSSPDTEGQQHFQRRTAPSRSRPVHQPVYVEVSTLEEEKSPASLHEHPQQQQPSLLPAAFSRLTQSIAAQEALLMSIQHERQKFHARRRTASDITDPVADELSSSRFEVVSEEEE